MINRKQFGRKFAEKYNLSYQDADQICRYAFELLGNLLYEEQEDVVISGFGAFKHKKTKSKNVRHPITGEILITPERDFVKFSPSEALSINGKHKLADNKIESGSRCDQAKLNREAT